MIGLDFYKCAIALNMVSKETANKLVLIARRQLLESSNHKSARLAKIKMYEEAYAGQVQSKLRSAFNLPNIVFSGLVDTLESDFDDPISLKFEEQDPADYKAVQKIGSAWKVESASLRPNAMWNLKVFWDKHNAIMSGRGIQKTWAEGEPKYKSQFEVVDYEDFHCEPTGGGLLDNHLFVGEEGIFRTREELEDGVESGIYDKGQIENIFSRAGDSEYKQMVSESYGEKLNRFRAMQLDIEANNYVGQEVYKLCQWQMTYKGKRYYLLFDAWTGEWVRCEENKEAFGSDLWLYTSWATHGQKKVFWTKSYADDLFPVGNAVKTLLDQELTNRNKRNLGARVYDKRFFPDVAKLDESSHRPEALVPATVPEGKSIQDGIFLFQTPELQGTINLANWLEQDLGKNSGITEINSQAVRGKGANIQYTLLQQAQKRIGSKAKRYIECYQQIGLRFLWGLVDHLSEPLAIKMIGKDGYGWDELTRQDLRLKRPFEVRIVNQTEEDKMNVLGKDQKIAALKMIVENELLIKENNPKVINEMIWRDIGGMNDDFIHDVMDTQNYGQKDVMAEADRAIKVLMKGKLPEVYFDATTGFLQRIVRWERANQTRLGAEKSKLFMDYIDEHLQIVQENMNYLASKMNMEQTMKGGQNEQPSNNQTPAGQVGSQVQNPVARQQQAPMVKRPAMAVGGNQ